MTHALTQDTHRLTLALYGLLRDLDPARLTDELAEGAQRRLATLKTDVEGLRERMEAEDPRAAIAAHLAELQRALAASAEARTARAREELVALQLQLQPTYEALASALRLEDIHVPSLRPTNYTRNAFHVLSALLALGLIEYALSPRGMVWVAGGLALFAWTAETARRFSPAANRALMWVFRNVSHPHEAHRVNSSTWYVTALACLALTGDPAICAAAVAILGVGDPAAAVIGRRFGSVSLVGGRSLEGTLAFVAFGALAAWGALSLWHPGTASLGLVLAATLPAALAELFSKRVDDNFTIPVAAAAGAVAWMQLVG